jgi:hypothetical protein
MSPVVVIGLAMPPDWATQLNTPAVVDERTQPLVPGEASALNTPEDVVCTTPAELIPETVIAGVVTVPVNVGDATVAYVACEVVEPSAFKNEVAEPLKAKVNVPVVATGEPVTVKILGAARPTDVTVPPPPETGIHDITPAVVELNTYPLDAGLPRAPRVVRLAASG